MAKKTYWTKCGIEFPKSTNADVTGYAVDENNQTCADCPFLVDVKEGWPQIHKRWECRAGSQKPNHTTDWIGSLEDKNTIGVRSLDNNFLEAVLEYCKNHSDLGASYNQDLADCRRNISVSCSANKKGIAAKRELIEKFFPVKNEDKPASTQACGKCNAGHWYSDENTYVSVVADDGIKTTKRPCEPHTHYCYQFAEGQKKIASAKDFNPDTAPEWCPLGKDIKYTYEADAQGTTDTHVCIDDPEWEDKWIGTSEKKKPRIGTESGCNEMNEDCPCFCSHNDGCSVLLVRGSALKSVIKNIYSKYDIDCDVYKKTVERVNGTTEIDTKVPEIANDLAEIDTKSVETVTFDYSTVDADTAEFLQEKASKITEIRLKSVLAIGKELKEAQDKLANNKNGTFGAWTSSIGISRQTAYNYINGYEFIVKNFDNIEATEDLSPSLLFAAAKKDAPKELTEQVVSGDITSLKEYKALEEKLKEAENQAEMATKAKFDAESVAIDAKQEARKAKKDRDDSIDAFTRDINNLSQQLEQAKRNSDPKKIKELGNIISEKQQEIETLKKQLKDKPIEVPAVKEVIPDEVRVAIFEKVSRLYEGILKLTETEIRIFAEDVQDDDRENIAEDISIAANRLDGISDTVMDLNEK